MDADSPDSLAHLAEDIHGSGLGIEDLDVPHVARWHDVHLAAERIARRNWLADVSADLVNGASQQAIAASQGVSQATLSRRYRASMEQLLLELNHRPGRQR